MINNNFFYLIIIVIFSLLCCSPDTNTEGSFFEVPETPEIVLPDAIPNIPNEPGFYVNGVNKGILLFADILDWINNNATDGAVYGIVLDKDITINPVTFSYSNKNVFIVLKGNTAGRTITLAKQGALFKIGQGVKFGLKDNIVLQGINTNSHAIVEVARGGMFIMDNGEITGNISSGGTGGILVERGGVLVINGGKIYNNTATQRDYITGGGGIGIVENGKFIMTGGEVSYNTSTLGGGISIRSNIFDISGGIITNNNATQNGGGIYLEISGTNSYIEEVTIKNLEIGNNKAGYNGGIYSYLRESSSLIIENTIIYGNIAESLLSTEGKGGGVYSRGSGSGGNIIKRSSGGIIYGNNAESNLQNIATNGGNAVHHDIYYGLYIIEVKKRNTTVTEYVELDSRHLGEWE
jgi:hypothetical protein